MFALPATLGVFAMILVLARLKVPLGLAIASGAIALGVIFGTCQGQSDSAALNGRVGYILLAGAVDPGTIALAAVTLLLMVMSSLMSASGQYEQIVGQARALLRRPSVAMAALPALVGLLPMPGGAWFSAPMVRSAAGKTELPGGWLSAINYWFRHIWEHWWPLYPGVVLAVATIRVDWGTFILAQLPLGLLMAASGLLLFRGTHEDLHASSPPPPRGTKRALLGSTSSIWLILVVWLPAKLVLEALLVGRLPLFLQKPVGTYAPLAVGLIASIAWTILVRRMNRPMVLKCLGQRNIYEMAGIVLSVMLFQHMISTMKAGDQIAAELTDLHVPLLPVVMLLPFIAGMVTGLAAGFVGTSFPIVLPAVQQSVGGASVMPYMVLAYAFGHLGQMASPVHVCHVVSNKYFETGFGPVYRRIWLPAVACGAAAVGYHFLLRAIM